MRASLKSVLAVLAVGSLTTSAMVFVGCSDDDGGGVTETPDAGGSDAPNGTDDGGTADNCENAPPKPARTCTAAQCTTDNNGDPSVCVDNQCVRLKSAECQFVSGAVGNDDALIIGSLLDINGSDKLAGAARQNSVELAVSEINAAGGVPTKDGCGSRPLIYVSCDDSVAYSVDAGDDAPSRRRAARHLAEELKTIAIVGPNNSNNTVELSTNVTNPAKALLIAPTAGAPDITTIANATQDGVRVLWRMIPSDALQGKAVAKYGERVATELNRQTIKAAIVHRDDPFGRGLRDGVKENLVLNGKPWGDATNTANVLEVAYAVSGTIDYAAARTALLDFQPDLIFFFGLGEITPNIIVPYEKANAGAANKPMWISSSSGQRNELITALRDDAELKATGLQARARGTSAQLTTALSQDFFNFRYKAKYAEPKTLTFGQTQCYDATYLVAFAAAATQPEWGAIPSIDIARALSKTIKGTEVVNVGPTRLKAGLEKLRSGGEIDFVGASGPLDFDPAVGEAPGDYAVWCIRTDPNTSAPVYENVTGMTWKYTTNTLEGTFTCPQN